MKVSKSASTEEKKPILFCGTYNYRQICKTDSHDVQFIFIQNTESIGGTLSGN